MLAPDTTFVPDNGIAEICVSRGIQWLDDNVPGWRKNDFTGFDVGEVKTDVLSLATGLLDYFEAIRVYNLSIEAAAHNGFFAFETHSDGIFTNTDKLNTAWLRALRREGVRVSA